MQNQSDSIGKDECRRCGTCCLQGGPALHAEDLVLFDEGVLSIEQLVSVRYLEPAHDPLKDKILPSRSEFVKIRGQAASWTCTFFDQEVKGCNIYRTRPQECRLLFCRDTAPLESVLWKNLLTRRELLSADDPVLSLIEQLDNDCSYEHVNELLAGLNDNKADVVEKLTNLVRFDLAVRENFMSRFSDRQSEELFLFGRPLFMVLSPHGFKLTEGPGGVALQIDNSSC